MFESLCLEWQSGTLRTEQTKLGAKQSKVNEA